MKHAAETIERLAREAEQLKIENQQLAAMRGEILALAMRCESLETLRAKLREMLEAG